MTDAVVQSQEGVAAVRALAEQHYDLGTIQAFAYFTGGSTKSRKWFVHTTRGDFVFKERENRPGVMGQITLAHQIQIRLRQQGLPATALVGTRAHRHSLIQTPTHIYELTELVRGVPFNASTPMVRAAGDMLARLHAALSDVTTPPPLPHRTFHHVETVARIEQFDPGTTADGPQSDAITELIDAYTRAYREVEALGFAHWPPSLIHGDWHPGNLIFTRSGEIAAIFDFDTLQWQPRVVDAAYATLQFAINREMIGPAAPSAGRSVPARDRFALFEYHVVQFLSAYEASHAGLVLSKLELRAVPRLMIEAIVSESIPMFAAQTEMIGSMKRTEFISLVLSTVRWIEQHSRSIIDQIATGP